MSEINLVEMGNPDQIKWYKNTYGMKVIRPNSAVYTCRKCFNNFTAPQNPYVDDNMDSLLIECPECGARFPNILKQGMGKRIK